MPNLGDHAVVAKCYEVGKRRIRCTALCPLNQLREQRDFDRPSEAQLERQSEHENQFVSELCQRMGVKRGGFMLIYPQFQERPLARD